MKTLCMLALCLVSYAAPQYCLAQDNDAQQNTEIDRLKTQINALNEKLETPREKVFAGGVSLGYRHVYSDHMENYQTPAISPIDSTLTLAYTDPKAVVLSTSMVVTPFVNNKMLRRLQQENSVALADKQKRTTGLYLKQGLLKLVSNVGIIVNINMADFSQAGSSSVFNKSIEGGFGISIRASDRIYFWACNSIIFSPQLRDELKARAGQKLYNNGDVVLTIDEVDDNSNFFITKNVIAMTYGIMIAF